MEKVAGRLHERDLVQPLCLYGTQHVEHQFLQHRPRRRSREVVMDQENCAHNGMLVEEKCSGTHPQTIFLTSHFPQCSVGDSCWWAGSFQPSGGGLLYTCGSNNENCHIHNSTSLLGETFSSVRRVTPCYTPERRCAIFGMPALEPMEDSLRWDCRHWVERSGHYLVPEPLARRQIHRTYRQRH